jgi:hypothetical protein
VSLAIRYAKVDHESNSQMREIDSLGPLARAALNYSPRLPDIKTFRSAFVVQWNRDHLDSEGRLARQCDLTAPDIDAAFAAYIEGILKSRMGDPAAWRHLEPKRQRRR